LILAILPAILAASSLSIPFCLSNFLANESNDSLTLLPNPGKFLRSCTYSSVLTTIVPKLISSPSGSLNNVILDTPGLKLGSLSLKLLL